MPCAAVDLDIAKGDPVSRMGPSGSGKTTLLNITGCIDRPGAGPGAPPACRPPGH